MNPLQKIALASMAFGISPNKLRPPKERGQTEEQKQTALAKAEAKRERKRLKRVKR